MPNLAGVLKDEIRRLARKEIRAELAASKKAVAQHRKDIAALKREAREQARKIAFLEKAQAKAGTATASTNSKATVRFSPKWLMAHRDRLELSAADYAELVGVSGLTIYNWEHGRTKPRAQQLGQWAKVRGIGKREAWRRLGY